MTTRELFFLVTSKRAWYKELNITTSHANMIKIRAKNGKFSESKMYEVLVKLGYECTWKVGKIKWDDKKSSFPSKKTGDFKDEK